MKSVKQISTRGWKWITGVGVLALSLGLAGPNFTNVFAGSPVIPSLAPAVRDAGVGAVPITGTFSPVVKKTAPAVVSIKVTAVRKAADSPVPFFGPGFGPGFEMPPRRQQGAGSGVIVTPEGHILTNHHVVDGATEIEVRLSDRRTFEGKIVGSDPKTDIAVVKIEGMNLPHVPLGNSDLVEVGDVVLAMGNPFGIGQTVTMGIVGATGRGNLNIEDYEDFIQTDAAINPGNSGGALLNTAGQLIGINTAILARGGAGNQGVGFAVPVNMAHHVMRQILTDGRVVRGYLGVNIQDLDNKMAKALNLPDNRGAIIAGVSKESPASEAGLETGDVIVGLNGDTVDDGRQLRLKIASLAPNSSVTLNTLREGEKKDVKVTLGTLPDDEPAVVKTSAKSGAKLGISVQALDETLAKRLEMPAGAKGVVVTAVDPNGPAAEADIQQGDVIQAVGRTKIASVEDLQAEVRKAEGDLVLLVNRQGNTRFVVVSAK